MFAILKKEINTFFASATGYLVIAVFLLLNGLFLWVFKGEFNVFDYGFADLSAFFFLAPWILTFLIPAITMKSFSDEARMGTLEVLLTRPVHPIRIVLGKYLGAFALVVLALLPTLLYILTLWKLGKPEGNLDLGSMLGSYGGLLFMASAYTAAGIFASTLSRNQIVSFIIAMALCFFLFFGFDGIASLSAEMSWVSQLGMKAHFESMARGVIDTRDLVYFLSLAAFFIFLTSEQLKKTGNA